MRFEWDESKRQSNSEKHSLDFAEALFLFEGDFIEVEAKQGKDGEKRFLAVGLIEDMYVTAIYTMRGDATRIISLRKARANERKQYQELYGG